MMVGFSLPGLARHEAAVHRILTESPPRWHRTAPTESSSISPPDETKMLQCQM